MRPALWLLPIFFLLIAGCQSEREAPTATPQAALDAAPSLSELAGTTRPENDGPPALSPELIGEGAQLYTEHCAECHGADLEGQPDWQLPGPDGVLRAPPHDETGHTWHHSDRVLHEAILRGGERLGSLGNSEMPAYAGVLEEREITAVLAFIKSTWSPRIRDIQWQQTVNDPLKE